MENKKQNLDIFSNLTCPSLPKWNDLPEIDLYMDQVIALMEKYLADTASQDSKLITRIYGEQLCKIRYHACPN